MSLLRYNAGEPLFDGIVAGAQPLTGTVHHHTTEIVVIKDRER
jgi:hypothetical protein